MRILTHTFWENIVIKSMFLGLVFWLVSVAVYAQPTIVNIEAEGNLAPTHNIGCLPISEMQNAYTPADAALAFQRCLVEENLADAAAMYYFIMAYGDYDKSRVADISAKQAIGALLYPITAGVSPEILEETNAELSKLKDQGSLINSGFCREIVRIGPPDYFPSYMVQHGMAVITGSIDEPLLADFDGTEKWAEVLSRLKCAS